MQVLMEKLNYVPTNFLRGVRSYSHMLNFPGNRIIDINNNLIIKYDKTILNWLLFLIA